MRARRARGLRVVKRGNIAGPFPCVRVGTAWAPAVRRALEWE